jgi:ABC-type transport system involved in multi-copper enzyme maturation permease subunit
MVAKLFGGLLITVAAIFVLFVAAGLIAGLLAPFIGNVPVSYNFRSIRAR